MSLDLDLIKWVIPTIIAGLTLAIALPASLKTWEEHRHIRRVHRRAESDYAVQLSETLDNSDIRRYAEELGYAALIGDRYLSHAQRKLLLSFPDAQQLVETYMRTRNFVEISCEKRGFVWKKSRFEHKAYRSYLRVAWFLVYVLSIPLAFSPWLIPWLIGDVSRPRTSVSGWMILEPLIVIIYSFLVATYSFRKMEQLNAAEELIKAREVISLPR